MSNVISLSGHVPAKTKAARCAALPSTFAHHRRVMEDVFWLKENAEFLSIMECTHTQFAPDALAPYGDFYSTIQERFAFFPQYYRFLTSITLDLEDLGICAQSGVGEALCAQVRQRGLAQAELSDLQRGEAIRLLARRGVHLPGAEAVNDRLHRFISLSSTFAIPNRKAAYELTHIVFYLSEYGRRDPQISAGAVQSLLFAGTLAHLEQNTDLLAEVCVALSYARASVPQPWVAFVAQSMAQFERSTDDAGAGDDYHEYLVGNWCLAQLGLPSFQAVYTGGGQGFYSQLVCAGALRSLSATLYGWPGPRCGDWSAMAPRIWADLSEPAALHLEQVQSASPVFEAFFEGFARAAPIPDSGGRERRAPQTSARGLALVRRT